MVTAHWWPMEECEEKLDREGCRYHHSRARDIVRWRSDGTPEAAPGSAPSPEELYRLDHDAGRAWGPELHIEPQFPCVDRGTDG
jgi:hypothetical protein